METDDDRVILVVSGVGAYTNIRLTRLKRKVDKDLAVTGSLEDSFP